MRLVLSVLFPSSALRCCSRPFDVAVSSIHHDEQGTMQELLGNGASHRACRRADIDEIGDVLDDDGEEFGRHGSSACVSGVRASVFFMCACASKALRRRAPTGSDQSKCCQEGSHALPSRYFPRRLCVCVPVSVLLCIRRVGLYLCISVSLSLCAWWFLHLA